MYLLTELSPTPKCIIYILRLYDSNFFTLKCSNAGTEAIIVFQKSASLAKLKAGYPQLSFTFNFTVLENKPT